MAKILICDGLENEAIKKMEENGHIIVNKHFELEELKERIKEFDAIVVRSATKVRKELIDAAKEGRLKLVIRGGVGVDNIDVDYAIKNGIEVRNTPDSSSASVAELTIAHMFAISRYIHISNITMRNNKWEKKKYEGIELFGKTLGLIGFGRIAKEVAIRAKALGMRVLYTDKLGRAKGYDEYEFCTLENLLKKSDFISVHVPFNKTAGAIIKKEEFEMMKEGVYIVNCARGGVIDENALLEALDSERVAGVGIDVFESEPTPNEQLVNHPKVCVTPHVGGSTKEAQERIGLEIVSIVEEFFGKRDNYAVFQYRDSYVVNA